MSVQESADEIVRIDRRIAEIKRQPVISTEDIATYRWLKEQRLYQVRALQNYKPPNRGLR